MGIEITEPCRVRLRCGGELDVEVTPDGQRYCVHPLGTPFSFEQRWSTKGRFFDYGDDTPLDIVEVLAPLKPVVIDGPGEYEVVECKCGTFDLGEVVAVEPACLSDDRNSGRLPWLVYMRGRGVIRAHFGHDGVSKTGNTSLRKRQFRQRPLTPDEAFKLLGKSVRRTLTGESWTVHRVGEASVELLHRHSGGWTATVFPSLAELARYYDPLGDFSLSVTEPIPFAG